MGQSASIAAIPMGQDEPVAELLKTQPSAAEAGPAPSRTTSRNPATVNALFILYS